MSEIQEIIKSRPKFSHKGTFGHLLLLAGRKGMAGAAVLSAKAALRSGAGLVSVHSAESNRIIVQGFIPEAIFQEDNNKDIITEFADIESYNAIAVGPGIGTKAVTTKMLKLLLETAQKPIVLDADALNIISTNKDLMRLIPQNSIITPHPKEFDRLFEKSENAYNRMLKAKENAQDLQIIIVLKGAHTLIALPDGTLFFNSTGNSGMATAGTGDVLTGIIGSFLAQSYSPENAAKLGVYIHGLAGDLALEKQSNESLIASDIIDSLGDTFKNIYNIRLHP
jgi:NAD(P)H-hydrate epimerase